MNPILQVPSDSAPWDLVYAIAHENIPSSWMLVGGLMTQAHAMLAGMSPRPTDGADFMVDLMSDKLGVSHLSNALKRHGYQISPGTLSGYTTRMVTPAGRKADILLADHLPRWMDRKRLTLLGENHMMSAPGGAQAGERCMEIDITDGERTETIRIPDVLGALILKVAAWMADNTPERSRHAFDAALLAGLIADPYTERDRLHSRNDWKRIRTLRDLLLSPEGDQYWEYVDQARRRQGKAVIAILAEA